MKKAWFVLSSVLLFIFGVGIYGFAEEAFKIGMDQYNAEDGRLTIYVNQNRESLQPSMEDSSLLVGKQKVNIEAMDFFETTGEPLSYLCVVDVSGSMDQARIEIAKESLRQFVGDKGELDNICITAMGNSLVSSGFLTDAGELNTFIDSIEVTREDTNLYHSIKEVLNVLKTDQAVHGKRCLVIFSDGADDQTVGITREEAEATVKEAHIPIFTVAMLKENPSEGQIESAKILGSFARYSAGGSYFAPVLDHYDYSEVYGLIKEQMNSSLVITADISDIIVGDETVYIEIEVSDGNLKAEDGMTVPAGAIVAAIREAQEKEEVSENLVEVVTEDTGAVVKKELEEENVNNGKILALAAIAAVILLLVIIAAVVLMQKGKRRSKNYQEEGDCDSESESIDVKGYVEMTGHTMAPFAEESSAEISGNKAKKKKVKITLFRIGPGEDEKHEFIVKESVKIGRNKGCQLYLPKDAALSGEHCSILYRNGDMFIRDEESTNGTYVNGVPIVGEFKLEKDDIVLFGSYEYRVYWE